MDIHSICPTGHIRPFCALATRLTHGEKIIIVILIVSSHVLNKTKTEVSCLFVDEPSDTSKALKQVRYYMLKRCALYALYLSASNLKDPLTIGIQPECRRRDGHGKGIRQCIPCSIPHSLRG